MSKITAGPSPCSSRMWQPITASRASSCGVMMSSAMPVSSRTRSMKSDHSLPGGRPRSRPIGRGGHCGVAACRRRFAVRPSRGPSPPRLSRPVWRQAFAQAHHPAERVDDHEVVTLRPRDQQAAVVGAQIDRGKASPRTTLRGRSGGKVGPRPAHGSRRGFGRRGRVSRRFGGGEGWESWFGVVVPCCLLIKPATSLLVHRRRKFVRHGICHSLSFSRRGAAGT